jgi:DNA polymerase-3 subunit chi
MKIDFYVLDATNGQKSLFFACQLLEKAYENKQRVYVHTTSAQESERLDALLWTYRDDSFIPHELYRQRPADNNSPPIQIGHDNSPELAGVLLNLSRDVPPFYSQFEHIIEIVFSDPVVQQLARVRYKHYRDQGHEINTIKVKANEI